MTFEDWKKEFDEICVSKGKCFPNREKQIDELYAIGKSPLEALTKEIKRDHDREYYFINLERDKANREIRRKQWRKKNPQKAKKNDAKYYKNHKKEINERQKIYRKNNRITESERNRKWKMNNKNKVKILKVREKARLRMNKIKEEIASLKNDNWFMEAHNKRIHLTK